MNYIQPIPRQAEFPLPQARIFKLLAAFFSYLFHPLFISVYVAAYLIYLHPYSFFAFDPQQKFLRLLSIFVITAFFPAFTVLLLWRLQFADSILLKTQKERIIPYVASIIYFFWAFFVARNLEGTPPIMVSFFLGTFLCASAALMANNYFKISMHALAVGGAATFMILAGLVTGQPMGPAIAIATLITGIVCTSRLIVSDHHPMEIYWGLILGALSQLVAGFFIL
ncbi:hypothetical protein [Segetibacter koreensis]|uniref:hypothetical protein n=1 Tax=Segetibacter koreensis TaxID=398037 RepID=UPI00036636E8|nr:hypothetical protein [Segetibacter koreensis]